MRTLSRTTSPQDFIAGYGPRWTSGLITDHVSLFVEAGGIVRPASSGSGAAWAVLPDGTTYPVLCSEMIWISTEDGRIDGRCGSRASMASGTCSAHEGSHLTVAAKVEQERARGEYWG
jgi:hypothetical protein